MKPWVRLSPNDQVIIALASFSEGQQLTLEDGAPLILTEDVSRGHKIATDFVPAGHDVHKFGYSIGKASVDIEPGTWVHTHNLRTGLEGIVNYSYEPTDELNSSVNPEDSHRTFMGYERPNGEVGIRNEIWIINTVGCINKTCELLAQKGNVRFGDQVDGIHHFAHPFGCSQLGDDLKFTQKLLASLVHHPNAAGVLIVGLGCENNQIDLFKAAIGDYDPNRVKFLKSQDSEDEIEEGITLIGELVDFARTFTKKPLPVAKIKIGLKCGGSDGFSGITANPLVGGVSDRLIAAGGTAILTEVPEMFGAETILMKRASDEGVFGRIVALINDFKEYYIRHNQVIYDNPSPGNKSGGISTLEEKSLGCTQKGGHSLVTDVVPYGERVVKPGLNLLEAPGNDLVSVTALTAAGAHIVLFTTGRGTPFGGPVPTVKISTNSELAGRKRNWIDFNAGRLLEGQSMEELIDELWESMIAIASGEMHTHNEKNGFKEIAIFKDGVIL
ncbi:UxaA family hydrolase [Paenibacillus sp. Soil787]|uniref:UxaA family hydrolase n=1 Tax=Paenibacillus sp. Soil787 TaxID=1736411 RepID=UPI0006FC8A97|nr:altronate dehydratase family protein [Paenibacillus sp. Soil787]KRF41884.1 altronate hydrolase [Paenibacillus sp. Soil787]